MATERRALLASIVELDSRDAQEPERPSVDQLDRLSALTQLTIQMHYATDEASLKVTLPPTT